MIQKLTIKQRRPKRVARIRALMRGTTKRPRLVIFRSHRALYGQLMDDAKRMTLASVKKEGTNIDSGSALGTSISVLCRKKKIQELVFDRGGYKYHGVIKKIADTVREGGIHI